VLVRGGLHACGTERRRYFPLDLVWDGISDNLGVLVSTWWENDRAVELLDAFRRVTRANTGSSTFVLMACFCRRSTSHWFNDLDMNTLTLIQRIRLLCVLVLFLKLLPPTTKSTTIPMNRYPMTDTGVIRVVEELKSRFAHYVKTGDDSRIPADLQNIIFLTVSLPNQVRRVSLCG